MAALVRLLSLVTCCGFVFGDEDKEMARCRECLHLVHAIHPALLTHVQNKAVIPKGYWRHALGRVCEAGTYCDSAFLAPYGDDIALELGELFEAAEGDPSDSSVKEPVALFSAVCAPGSITEACPRRAAAEGYAPRRPEPEDDDDNL